MSNVGCADCFDRSVTIPIGPAGQPGQPGENGVCPECETSANAENLIFLSRNNAFKNSAIFVDSLDVAEVIPANTWENVGDTVNIKAWFHGDALIDSEGTAWTNSKRYEFKLVIGSVEIPLWSFSGTPTIVQTYSDEVINGGILDIDIILMSGNIFHIINKSKGFFFFGIGSGRSNYIPNTSGYFISGPNITSFFISDVMTMESNILSVGGITPSIDNPVQVKSRWSTVGSGSAAVGHAVPYIVGYSHKIKQ